MISIALALLLSQTGTCKTGTVCQSSRYEANTPYGYLKDGGVPRQSDGGVIYPQPALKVKTTQTAMTAVGVNFNQLPPCPSIAVSSMQWVNDKSCWYTCTTGGWTNMCGGGGSTSDGGISGSLAPLFTSGSNIGCTTAGSGVAGCVSATTQTISGAKTLDTLLTAAGGIDSTGAFIENSTSQLIVEGTIANPAAASVVINSINSGAGFVAQFSTASTPEAQVDKSGQILASLSGTGSGAAFTDADGRSGHLSLTCRGGASGCYTPVSGDLVQWADNAHTVPYGGLHGEVELDSTNPRDAGFLVDINGFSWVDFRGAWVQTSPSLPSSFDFCGARGVTVAGGNPVPGIHYMGEFDSAQRWGNDHKYYVCEDNNPDGGVGTWDPIATQNNGVTGGILCGTLPSSLSVHQSNTLARVTLLHPIPSGATVNMTFGPIIAAGTIGGTYDLVIRDQTTATNLCTILGTSCTASSAVTNSCASTAGASIGDVLSALADTTNCTGTDPTATLCASW